MTSGLDLDHVISSELDDDKRDIYSCSSKVGGGHVFTLFVRLSALSARKISQNVVHEF